MASPHASTARPAPAPAAPVATGAHPAPAIDVAGLTRTFEVGRRRHRRTVEAVAGITFRVEAGERLAFIGPNGAGKSTSIKMLTGVLQPTAGRARVLGLEPWRERRALSRRIGTLFGQRSALWSDLTARASLQTLGAIHGLDRAAAGARTTELADLLDATDLLDQPVRTLSLGQRMRCELAACMLHRPSLLFLDEPTIGLDLLAKQRFREVLVRLNRELGTTVVLTSHDVADVEHVAQRAIIVNHGTIIHDSPVPSLRRDLLSTKRIEITLADDGPTTNAGAAAGRTAPADGTARPPGTAATADRTGRRGQPVGADDLAAELGAGVTVAAAGSHHLWLDVDTAHRPIGPVLTAVLARWPLADLSVVDPPLETVIGEIYRRPG